MKQKSLSRSIIWVAFTTALLLCVPLIAMQFTTEVNWSVSDFVIAGILIFVTGLSYVLLTRSSVNILNRLAVAFAIGSTFFLIWANLAVGLIGSGPNPANFMYTGVVAIVIFGTFLFRFSAKGMERVMFAAAISLVLFGVIQLLTKMYEYPGSSVAEIIGVNTFFATLFAVCGLLFRYIRLKHLSGHTGNTVQ